MLKAPHRTAQPHATPRSCRGGRDADAAATSVCVKKINADEWKQKNHFIPSFCQLLVAAILHSSSWQLLLTIAVSLEPRSRLCGANSNQRGTCTQPALRQSEQMHVCHSSSVCWNVEREKETTSCMKSVSHHRAPARAAAPPPLSQAP